MEGGVKRVSFLGAWVSNHESPVCHARGAGTVGKTVSMASMTGQDSLFEAEPAPTPPRSSSSPGEVAVDKTFRAYDQDQTLLMPPSLRDWLPDDHLALFVSELVEEVLDLTPFLASTPRSAGSRRITQS